MRALATATITAVLVLVAGASRVHAQSLDAARDLYASAEYEGALTMLDSLLSRELSLDEKRVIETYRVLCLVATGKESDAEGAIAALVARDPLYRPTDDLPPRVRSTFSAARKRLLPSAVQTTYQEAKAAFDLKDYETAERGFSQVLEVLADPDVVEQASQSPLKDLRMLAAGFHELSLKAKAPVEPVAAAPPPPMAPVPAPVARADRIYSAEDRNVVPPIAINQSIPPFPGPIRTTQSGVIEVLIDRTGVVESAAMFGPISPQYDRLALNAARDWQYQPARLDGVPVKFLKRIQVNIVPSTTN
jgi:hypothetical protein